MSDTMLFRSYVPRPPLDLLVADFWLYENYDASHQRELILPSGTFEMVFNLAEDELRIYGAADPHRCRRFSGAVVSGPYAGSFMSDGAEEKSLLGVHFKAGGAAAFLGLPASDFRDEHVDLGTIWGPPADALRERLCALTEPVNRFRLLEQTLLRRLCAHAGGHAAVRGVLDLVASSRGTTRTRDLAAAVQLSQRRLIALFAAEVGLTPKVFGRITRFQHAIARSRATVEVDWAQLAVECGYYDQSHLIHDFAEFAGVGPDDYRRRHGRLERAGTHTKRPHLPLAGVNLFQ
jgi:AraC-like DNA-binding protein